MIVIEKLNRCPVVELEILLTKYVNEVMKFIEKDTYNEEVMITNFKPRLSNDLLLLTSLGYESKKTKI